MNSASGPNGQRYEPRRAGRPGGGPRGHRAAAGALFQHRARSTSRVGRAGRPPAAELTSADVAKNISRGVTGAVVPTSPPLGYEGSHGHRAVRDTTRRPDSSGTGP